MIGTSAIRSSSAAASACCPASHQGRSPSPGDRIIALGGRTGRDGIHGATFSSAELESTASRPSSPTPCRSATRSKRSDCSTRSCGRAMFRQGRSSTAITDCGAGGFSSAIGEMGRPSARGHAGEGAAEVRRPLVHRDLDQRGAGAHDPRRAPANLPRSRRSAMRRASNSPTSALRHAQNAELILTTTARKSAASPCTSCTMASRCRRARRCGRCHRAHPVTAHPVDRFTASRLRLSGTLRCHSPLSHPTIASKHWIIRSTTTRCRATRS
jgi:hypothetical protein